MKRVIGIFIAVSLCASAVASVAFAQQPQAANQRAIEIVQQRIFQGPEGAPMPPPPPGADFVWIATENFSGKTVKGAPYSAEAVTESVQPLADGNRIVNKFTSQVYRDGEGRTRREQTLKALGPVGTGEEPLQTIFINDPVAGVSYSLDTRSHTAHKSMPFRFQVMTKSGAPGEGNTFEFKSAQGAGATSNVIVTTQAAPGQPGQHVDPRGGDDFGRRAVLGGVQQFDPLQPARKAEPARVHQRQTCRREWKRVRDRPESDLHNPHDRLPDAAQKRRLRYLAGSYERTVTEYNVARRGYELREE